MFRPARIFGEVEQFGQANAGLGLSLGEIQRGGGKGGAIVTEAMVPIGESLAHQAGAKMAIDADSGGYGGHVEQPLVILPGDPVLLSQFQFQGGIRSMLPGLLRLWMSPA